MYHEHTSEPRDWFAVRDELEVRRAKSGGGRRASTDSLLRGLLVCGRCGDRIEAVGYSYGCRKSYEGGSSCVGNTVSKQCVESLVVGAALALLADHELRLAADAASEPTQREQINTLNAEAKRLVGQLDILLDVLLESVVNDDAAKGRFQDRQRTLEEKLRMVNVEPAHLHQKAAGRHSDVLQRAGNVEETWSDLPTHTNNAILHDVIDSVVVGPASRRGGWGGGKFDPSRIDIQWARD